MKIYTIYDCDIGEVLRTVHHSLKEAANYIMKGREKDEVISGDIEDYYIVTEISEALALNVTNECEVICQSIASEIEQQREHDRNVYKPIVL